MRIRWPRPGTIGLATAVLALGAAAWIRCGAIPGDLFAEGKAASTTVLDRHGQTLYESLSAGGTRQLATPADRLPPLVVAATVAAEDRRFWSHPGVDVVALARAATHDVRAGHGVEGGSTITQQVAKLLIARRDGHARHGVVGKVREAVLALRLEHRFTKREIVAMYLSLAAYGGQIVGVERASHEYFGCSASMLTPAQAAFLAALPQQPSRFNPYRDASRARPRQRSVLRAMERGGALSEGQLREAFAERLTFERPRTPFVAPHFVEMVLASFNGSRPARIQTTLDGGLQSDVESILAAHREMLRAHGAANVAVVVLDNANAEWLAWEGSGDYYDSAHGGAINGALALRQPGSALKPLTYAVAFEQGQSPATVLPDIPAHFPTAEPGVLFTPRNYDGRYRGPLLARRALAGSENVPAVAVAANVGVPALLRFYARAGLTTFDRTASFYGLGITLGNAEVRLAELVGAYSAFARNGTWLQPVAVTAPAVNRDAPLSLVSPRTAFWITDVLSDPDAREYIFGRGGALELPFPVAVKTGTSQAYHDNWTIGYTRDLTVGVWVGNFDRTPLRNSSGVTGAAPIFHAVMLAATRRLAGANAVLGDKPVAMPPEGLERVEICALSGMRATPACPLRAYEWLPADDEKLPCSWHHASDEGLLTVWPPEYRQWALEQGLLAADAGRAGAEGLVAGAKAPAYTFVDRDGATRIVVGRGFSPGKTEPLEIVNPPNGAIYSIDPTLRREFQALPLRVVTATPGTIDWQVDGTAIGNAPSDGTVMWPLAVGTHIIAARDERGHTARATVVVK